MKISIKLHVFSNRLFVSSHGRRGGGVHRGSDVEGGGQQWGGGATARWGGLGAIGGSTEGVSSTSKNRPSQHKYKSPKHFELKQS